MEFVKMLDLGPVPEYVVDGIGRLDAVSAQSIRMSYYATHWVDGDPEHRLVLQVRWDRGVWQATRALFEGLSIYSLHIKPTDLMLRQ